jgi:uncharacterized membrane protein (UPF0127 family)
MAALSKDGVIIIPHLTVARRFHERLLGLMGRAPLGPGRALLLQRCGSIHTCFMRFPLDVIFVDDRNIVVRRISHLRPWRVAWGGHRAVCAIELESGWLAPQAIKTGDRLISSLPLPPDQSPEYPAP